MVELAMERRKLTAESVNTSQIMDKSLNDSVESNFALKPSHDLGTLWR